MPRCIRKIPFVRGVFVFITSMIDGYKCLSRSADKQMKAEEDGEEKSLQSLKSGWTKSWATS